MGGIGFALAIVVGLVSSFIQSLGLTIQRKSHVQNDALPLVAQVRPIRRPLWLLGFGIYITSNIFSTIFQLDTLPIVILAPLGAVSLIYNAVLAWIILGDRFGARMVGGTGLVAVGAVLIAVFGVVEEMEHPIEELLVLWGRPAFLAFFWVVMGLTFIVLITSHIVSYFTYRSLRSIRLPLDVDEESPKTPPSASSVPPSNYASPHDPPSIPFRQTVNRRWSAPLSKESNTNGDGRFKAADLQQLNIPLANGHAKVGDTASPGSSSPKSNSPISSPSSPTVAAGQTSVDTSITTAASANPNSIPDMPTKRQSHHVHFAPSPTSPTLPDLPYPTDPSPLIPGLTYAEPTPAQQKTITILGLSFAAASGIISGMSLVLAKAAVELLILTLEHYRTGRGANQFNNFQSWLLVAGLLTGGLAQLVYLNYSLTFASPALICPLAFCFFNLSSIFDGLVFYDQFSRLRSHQIALVSVGVAFLLIGVWVVSVVEPTGQGGVDIGTWAEEDEDGDSTSLFTLQNGAEGGRSYFDDIPHVSEPEGIRDSAQMNGHHQPGPSVTSEPGGSPSTTSRPEMPRHDTFPFHLQTSQNPLSPVSPGPASASVSNSMLVPTTSSPIRRRRIRYGSLLPDLAPIGPPPGFSIGLGAASPGFVLRPEPHPLSPNMPGGVDRSSWRYGGRGRSRSEGAKGVQAIIAGAISDGGGSTSVTRDGLGIRGVGDLIPGGSSHSVSVAQGATSADAPAVGAAPKPSPVSGDTSHDVPATGAGWWNRMFGGGEGRIRLDDSAS